MKCNIIAVIPAYNEGKKIANVVKGARKYVDKTIVIDDHSSDNTYEIARKCGAEVIRLEKNNGVGFATRVGIKRALSLKPKIVIFLDGDGQHDPKYIPYFLKAIENGANYVYGYRDLSNYPMSRRLGNFGLTTLINLICRKNIADAECGYRAIDAESLKKLNLRAKRYEREMDFIYEVWKNKLKVDHVNIIVSTYYPKYAVVRGFMNFFFFIKRRIGNS